MFLHTVPHELVLGGGDVTEGIVRVGGTVRRPTRASTPSVHAFLRHLEAAGFDGAPRVIGLDGLDREILTFIEGEVAARPLPAYAVTDETLVALARLLRRFHDAAETFTPPPGAIWEDAPAGDGIAELVGHCDVTPGNVVFRKHSAGGPPTPYALIDFDLARPTTRLFDVVTTLRHWAPIADPIDVEPAQRDLDVGARLRLFSDAYGLGPRDRRRLLEVARSRFDRSYAAMRDKAATAGGGWARMWDSGAGPRIRRAAAWLDGHEDELRRHLV